MWICRTELKQIYKTLILQHIEVASKQNIEQMLWKTVYHQVRSSINNLLLSKILLNSKVSSKFIRFWVSPLHRRASKLVIQKWFLFYQPLEQLRKQISSSSGDEKNDLKNLLIVILDQVQLYIIFFFKNQHLHLINIQSNVC